MKLFTIAIGLFLFVHGSYCYIWQNKDHMAAYINNYYKELSKIPPKKETAARFAKYFLNRDVVIGRHPHVRVPRDIDPAPKPIKRIYDIALIIDSSDSVKRANFNRGLRALQRMVERGLPDTNYAAITFSNHAKLEFVFTNKEKAKEQLKKIKYRPGKTNTEEALRMALNRLMKSNTSNIRDRSGRRILLVTDGLSNVKSHLTLLRGWQLKRSGAEIFVLAVGRYNQGFEEIVGLASSTHAHLYRVAHMRGFLRVMKLIPLWPLNANEDKSWLSDMIETQFQGKKRKTIRN